MYKEIIERLEAAHKPDAKLNLAIFRALHPEYDDFVEGRGGLVHPNDSTDMRVLSDVRWPAYTSDLNSVITLVERKLPNTGWNLGGNMPGENGEIISVCRLWFENGVGPVVEHKEPAIALLIAFFNYLEAQEK